MNEPANHLQSPRSAGLRPLLLLVALQFSAILLWYSFAQVAHYGYRNYFILMALAWVAGAILTLLWSRWRWFWFALLIICVPRLAGIVLQAPAHSLLFPWLAGLSLGLSLRVLLRIVLPQRLANALFPGLPQRSKDADLKAARRMDVFSSGPVVTLVCFGIFLVIGTLRAFFEAYSPYVLTGLPVLDLEMAPGVSANYGFYLSLLLILNLAGPLLFYFSDFVYETVAGNSDSRVAENSFAGNCSGVSRQLILGLAGGAMIHLCALLLESLGFLQLASGAGDYWRQAGRLPGILTDSGASTLMTPFLIATLLFVCYHLGVGLIPVAHRSSRFRRYVLPGAAAGIFALSILFPLSYWHGRAFFLNLAGALFLAGLVSLAIYRRGLREERPVKTNSRRWFRIIAVSVVVSLVFAALGFWFFQTSDVPAIVALRTSFEFMLPQIEQGNWHTALSGLDPARVNYLIFGVRMFLESPWIGHGLNSFQVELPRFANEAPSMLIDNPGSLPLGLLSDGGLVGALISGTLFVWIGLRFIMVWKREGDSATLWLAGLPLAFLPAMFLGFHLVLSEFAALLLLPFLLRGPAGRSTENAASLRHTAFCINVSAAALVSIWLIGTVTHFTMATGGPELWRFSKTGRPQPALQR